MPPAMMKKYGPLPMWAWLAVAGATIGAFMLYRSKKASSTAAGAPNPNTVDPSSPVGATYAQEAQDQALGIDPITGQTYAQEQASAAAGDQGISGTGGGTGGGGVSSTDPALVDALGSISTALQSLPGNGGVVDQQTPSQSFGGELSDVASGISDLQTVFPGLFAQAPGGGGASKKPSLTAKGAKRAPSGPDKPKAPKGFKAVGLGSGNWEFVPTKHPGSGGGGNSGNLKAPSGPRKPKAPKGYTARGLGRGRWEFVPVTRRTNQHAYTPPRHSSHSPPRRRHVSGKKKG